MPLLFSLWLALAASLGPADPDPLETVRGTWGWADETRANTCATNPHTITVSEDGRQLTLTYPHPIDEDTGRRHATYKVLDVGEAHLRLLLVGETRRDDRGERVARDLIFLGPDRYVWRRSDWPPDSGTAPLERCPEAE